MEDNIKDDPPLTEEDKACVKSLSNSDLLEIDAALKSNISTSWRKVARIIGTTIIQFEGKYKGVPDVFYAQRIKSFVENGFLISQGNLKRMRYSEVKLKNENEYKSS